MSESVAHLAGADQNGTAYQLLDQGDAEFAKALDLPAAKPAEAPAPEAVETPEATPETTPEPEAETTDRPRDEKGRFVAEEKPATEEPASDAAKKPPLTKFEVIGPDGQPVQIDPTATVRAKVDGKLVDLPLEKVVHLSQQNAVNARLAQQQAESAKRLQEQLSAYEQAVQVWERVLAGDDAALAAVREQYQQATSPEARAQSAEQRLAELESQRQQEQMQGIVTRFASEVIDPTLQSLATQHEGVSADVLYGQLALLIEPLRRNGAIPVEALPQVQSLIENDLSAFAKAESDRVMGLIRSQQQQAQQAKATAQAVKRDVGKALSAAPGSVAPAKPSAPPVASASDVFLDPLLGGFKD